MIVIIIQIRLTNVSIQSRIALPWLLCTFLYDIVNFLSSLQLTTSQRKHLEWNGKGEEEVNCEPFNRLTYTPKVLTLLYCFHTRICVADHSLDSPHLLAYHRLSSSLRVEDIREKKKRKQQYHYFGILCKKKQFFLLLLFFFLSRSFVRPQHHKRKYFRRLVQGAWSEVGNHQWSQGGEFSLGTESSMNIAYVAILFVYFGAIGLVVFCAFFSDPHAR